MHNSIIKNEIKIGKQILRDPNLSKKISREHHQHLANNKTEDKLIKGESLVT